MEIGKKMKKKTPTSVYIPNDKRKINVQCAETTRKQSIEQNTGWAKKTAPNFSCNNFGKYGPILIMFSLLQSQMN